MPGSEGGYDEDFEDDRRKAECMACLENDQPFTALATRECAKYDYDDEDHHYFTPGRICSTCCRLEFGGDSSGCFDVCQDTKAIPENLKGSFGEFFDLKGLNKSELRKSEVYMDDIGSFLITSNLGGLLDSFSPRSTSNYIEDEVNEAVYVKGDTGAVQRYSLENFRGVKKRMSPAVSWLLHDIRTTDDGLLFLVCEIGDSSFGAVLAPQDKELIRPSDVVGGYVERSEELREFFDLRPVLTPSVTTERIAASLDGLDEDGVIDAVAVPLLKKMGFADVARIPHHGPGEQGLDIGPFFRPNIFDPAELEYAGAQVKAQKIYGKAGTKEGSVYELMDQIDAAFEKSRTIRGREEYIRKLYVICSGEITHDADALLEDKIKNLRGQRKIVVLIKRARLIEMIEEAKLPIVFR